MLVFSDLHHKGLAESLQLLFEKRLGHQLFFPYGLDWFPKYWKIGDPYGETAINTAKQFLTGELPSDGTGVVTIPNKMTFYEFINTDIDVLIASIPEHIEPYKELIKLYHPKAKLIFQIGNSWSMDYDVKNVLASIHPMTVPEGINAVFYHQEFELPGYKAPEKSNKITSFVNCLGHDQLFQQDWKEFLTLEHYLKGFECRSYGASCRDGNMQSDIIGDMMSDSHFSVHLKQSGDGYGHVAHGWGAVGRPVIFRGDQYKGKLAGKLFKHLETGFDLDKMSCVDVAHEIRTMSPGSHRQMCESMYKTFKQEVDFDKEEQSIQEFMGRLQ